MQPTSAPAHSQRVSRVIADLQIIATTFVMHVMVGRDLRQLKMPRPPLTRELPTTNNTGCCAAQPYQRRSAMHSGGREQVHAQAPQMKHSTGTGVRDLAPATLRSYWR